MLAAEILDEDDNPRKAAALALAARGFYVFPVQRNEKRPDPLLAPKGHHGATTDAETVGGWFDAKPSANIGIACGQACGLVVVDVDVKNGARGMDSYKALDLGSCTTLTAKTPTGGYHLYFRYPDAVTLKAKHPSYPGIDIKGGGAGGYVLAAPSTLPGGAYQWLDAEMPIAEMPFGLVAALEDVPEKPREVKPRAASATDELKTLEGERHAKLLQLAGVYRGKGLEPHDIEALLWHHATRYFEPPFARDNDQEAREIEQLAFWIGQKEMNGTQLVLLTGEELATRAKERPSSFIAEPVLPTAGSMMVFGPTGHGKSHLAIAFALALARGQSFLDWKVTRPYRVLFCDGEMPLAALHQRAARYLCGEPLPNNLLWLCEAAQEEVMPNLADETGQAHYLKMVERTGAEVVFFDNLTALRQTTADAPENSVEAFQPVLRLFKRLARRNVAAVMLHHAGKSGQQRGTSAHGQPFDAVVKISLSAPPDRLVELDVEIFFDKARWFTTGGVQRAKVAADDNDFERWELCADVDDLAMRVAELVRQGQSQVAIARSTGYSRRGVQKAITRAQARGLLNIGEGNATN